MSKSKVQEFGWTAVPRGRGNVPSEAQVETRSIEIIFDTIWPQTGVVQKAQEYAQGKLPVETYNHSLRVYSYGHAIITQHFPSWIETARDPFLETWALTCLFHDIGTIQENRHSTHLSFEFQGGFIALQQLQSFGAPQAQAESVCEAIIRHQDPGETGTISQMGQLIQLATEFDNMGGQPYLIHKDVIERVVKQHPRLKWSSCFAASIQEEIDLKPWCHTTKIPGFKEAVAGNELMKPYE
ncbi:Putative HD/PDEase domain, cyanamide hydratase [Septoria linicola]|uniref:HD/PDEase domain, cyanamide hydratase n=1 Tax=Septoria linicola TaxID=215465 RepID=A0A9Q9EH61_9PEZI|nr:putative HD/PDEase domain, cyanamide hydratase [Septoria linicola]USW49562.1 Putative HD/PDEase domain, cyanamide hydratase [Septoria linicola]